MNMVVDLGSVLNVYVCQLIDKLDGVTICQYARETEVSSMLKKFTEWLRNVY